MIQSGNITLHTGHDLGVVRLADDLFDPVFFRFEEFGDELFPSIEVNFTGDSARTASNTKRGHGLWRKDE